ncbi:hypothetical protein [Hyphomonas sp.]|uniref:hypothetical protein n=1 Tax=Hyphomonas sp. TaxID=87 RepID=UPI003001D172
MIQGAFFSLFNFVSNNKVAQIILLCGVGYFIMRWKEEADEARGARRAKERAEKATRKAADKTLKKMEQDNEDTIESAREARSNVPDGVDSTSLRDDHASILFGDD